MIGIGADGALVPSVQHPGGVNFVLWKWSATTDDGANIQLIDPHGDLWTDVRDRIPALKKLADRQGVERIDEVEVVAPPAPTDELVLEGTVVSVEADDPSEPRVATTTTMTSRSTAASPTKMPAMRSTRPSRVRSCGVRSWTGMEMEMEKDQMIMDKATTTTTECTTVMMIHH